MNFLPCPSAFAIFIFVAGTVKLFRRFVPRCSPADGAMNFLPCPSAFAIFIFAAGTAKLFLRSSCCPAGRTMDFARRNSAASAADAVNDGRSVTDPPWPLPPHGDSMQMIRDALLSQLQKDRLRQEIIVAELAKIERAMDLRAATADAERTSPAPFDFDEQFMTREGKRSEEHHAKEDDPVSESSKASFSTCKTAGDQKNQRSDDEAEPQETSEAKKSQPSMKWSCAICQVEATSAGNLLQHFSGQKHRANVDALKAEARKSRKAKQGAEQTCPPWTCRFCQAKCTSKSDLENHLKGKKHRAKIQALLEECENMAKDSASSSEVDSYSSNTSQDEEEPASESVCCICQVKWYCQSVMEDHLRGKKHRNNFQALQLEAKRLGIIQPKVTKEQESGQWDCTICQVRCNSESQFKDHCRSTGHKQMEKASYFCKLCNLQCNSAKMLAHHQSGRKHKAKLRSC